MGKSTAVLLITGFLGSGKTTFLNRIINEFPQDLKLALLMNEFGEIGIDGDLVEGDEIDMLEISRGSIFCVCVKNDFIKGLYELNNTVKPDLLIIESTGVANPTDLKRDLQLPIFKDRFTFAEQVCIIDAAHFLGAYEAFVSVEKQLETSTSFIINKTDMVDGDVLDNIRQVIAKHHPEPIIYETTYSKVPFSSFPSLTMFSGSVTEGGSSEQLSGEQLDAFITDMLDNSDAEATPPDQMASVIYVYHGDDPDEIKAVMENLPAGIVRSKGVVKIGDGLRLFSYVMGDVSVTSLEKSDQQIKHLNTFVFIGKPDAVAALGKMFTTGNWSGREVVQPFTGLAQL